MDYVAFYQRYIKELRVTGRNATGLCPLHEDSRPSFSANLETGLWQCFGCGDKGNAAQFLAKVRGLTPAEASAELAHLSGTPERIVAIYDYRDETGQLLFQVVRLSPKGFRQRHPDGGTGWLWNLQGVRRVLYRLPELVAAPAEQPVFVCEGEKDADALGRLGLVATTCPGGAGKWRDDYSASLRGKQVAILPDNDEPGRKHAEQVAASLQGVASSLKVISLPGLPPKGDVSDWLTADGTKEELLRLVAEAPEWKPTAVAKALPWVPSADLMRQAADAPEIEWLVEGLIPRGLRILLTGSPGHYKTWLAFCLARAVASGGLFLGRRCAQAPVIYIDRENPRPVALSRFKLIGAVDQFFYWPSWAEEQAPNLEGERYDEAARLGGLIILDSLARFHALDENEASQMKWISARLHELINLGGTVLVLHHRGKGDGATYRGSEELAAGFDECFLLARKSDVLLELKGFKNRLVLDTALPIRVVSDPERFDLVDAKAEVAARQQAEEAKRLEALRDVIAALECEKGQAPNQSAVLERAVAVVGLGEKAIADLLTAGAGRYWTVTQGPKRARLYRATVSSAAPQSLIRGCESAEVQPASGNGSCPSEVAPSKPLAEVFEV